MPATQRDVFERLAAPVIATHSLAGAPRRLGTETFIRGIFARRYGAEVPSFAPNLLLLEQRGRTLAACGWRPAGSEALFLERYLDQPIERALSRLANQPVDRQRIVEVGNLAAEKAGSSIHVILTLADHLHRQDYEWVVFTATSELIGIFTRLGLPLLALAPADPTRLGNEATVWGSYYDTRPIVVAGRIRLGLERAGRLA